MTFQLLIFIGSFDLVIDIGFIGFLAWTKT